MEEREALESMVWQFGYRGIKGGKPNIHTGGLSALEEAFSALNWDDPHFIPEEGATCEVIGCMEEDTAGIHWGKLYLRLCYEHTKEAAYKPLPGIKQYALDRESKRGVDGVLKD